MRRAPGRPRRLRARRARSRGRGEARAPPRGLRGVPRAAALAEPGGRPAARDGPAAHAAAEPAREPARDRARRGRAERARRARAGAPGPRVVVDEPAWPGVAPGDRDGGADPARRRASAPATCCGLGDEPSTEFVRGAAAERRGAGRRRRSSATATRRPCTSQELPAIADDEVYEVWVQRAGVMEPRSTFVLGMDGTRRGRGPRAARGRRGGARHPRAPPAAAASRPPSRCSTRPL